MATYSDEPVDSYFYSSYNPYIGRYHRPKDGGWKYRSYLSHCGDTAEAFSNQQRAQLKSILSQINPKLTPRLRKANTKDVAVQVNPRRDASVQCAIGPRTLLAMKRDFRRKRQREAAAPGGVRYPRTLAVYSPVAFRSVTSFLVDENNNKKKNKGMEGDEDSSCGEPPGDPPEPAAEGDGKKSEDQQGGKTAKPPEQNKRDKCRQQRSENVQQTAEGSKARAPVRFQVRRIRHRKEEGLQTPQNHLNNLNSLSPHDTKDMTCLCEQEVAFRIITSQIFIFPSKPF